MKELLTKHWLAKLLSLLLAIGIWVLVSSRIDANNDSEKKIKGQNTSLQPSS